MALGWAVATAAWAADADRVIARVNGIDIKAGDLTLADEDIGSNLPMSGDARRDYLTRYLIDMQLIAQAAETPKTRLQATEVGATASVRRIECRVSASLNKLSQYAPRPLSIA